MNIRTTLLAAAVGALPLVAGLAPAAPMMMSAPMNVSPEANAALFARLASANPARGLDADHGFALASQHPGVAGTQVTRAVHTYKGVRVFGSESVVVTDASGKILSESLSDRRAALGKGSAGHVGVNGAARTDFDVKPRIARTAAIETAIKSLKASGTHVTSPSAELIVFPIMKTQRVPAARHKPEAELNALDVQEVVDRHELAYLVHTRMLVGQRPAFYDTVVSARTGKVLAQWSMLQTVLGKGMSQYNGEVPISTTELAEGGFQMLDQTRGVGGEFGAMAITNADHGTSAGKVFTSTLNEWGDGRQYIDGGSTTDANGQTAAVNAMWGLMNTYDMLGNTLGWQSLDGHNTSTYIAAHVNAGYDNAYYSDTCKCMFIGDGSYFNSLGAIDVIGHEMGHGVTAATADLVYSGESGGLNESASDIAGEAVEAYARAGGKGELIPNEGNDWATGKEISKDGVPLRYMYKPSKDGSSPDAWSNKIKRLDVHYSSGPNNRMFYFLSQGSQADVKGDYGSKYLVKTPKAMTGIGTDKAYRIWFKALTTKFTSTTNYADARAKVLLAAQELYGADSKEAIAVQRAYAAINVGADVDE
ncbi:MAG: M4 family metallopeptidase [Massilia sp.]